MQGLIRLREQEDEEGATEEYEEEKEDEDENHSEELMNLALDMVHDSVDLADIILTGILSDQGVAIDGLANARLVVLSRAVLLNKEASKIARAWRRAAQAIAARRELRPSPKPAKLTSSGSELETSGSEMESEEEKEELSTVASIFAGSKPPKQMKRRKRSSLRASLTRRLHL